MIHGEVGGLLSPFRVCAYGAHATLLLKYLIVPLKRYSVLGAVVIPAVAVGIRQPALTLILGCPLWIGPVVGTGLLLVAFLAIGTVAISGPLVLVEFLKALDGVASLAVLHLLHTTHPTTGVPPMSGSDNISMTTRSTTVSTTLTQNDYVLLCSPTGGSITVTLPAVAAVPPGRTYFVQRDDTATNTVTLDGSGAETINGAATLAVGAAGAYGAVRVISDGVEWFTIGEFD